MLVVETDDSAAFMEQVRPNSQGELTPLERGMHALKSGMDLKGNAEAIGRWGGPLPGPLVG